MKLSRALLALALCGCAFISFADPVSFADLAKHSQYGDVKISPDGKYIAATAVINDQTVLALIDLRTMKGNTVRPRDEDDVIDFWWASPTRVVYDVGLHWGGYDRPLSTGELFAVNADGKSADMLYGMRMEGMQTGTHINHAVAENGWADFIAPIPGDPDHALVSVSDADAAGNEGALPIAYKMDLRDGRKVRIVAAPLRGATFVADHKGNIRLVYGTDNNDNAKVYERPADGGDWRLLPEASDDRDTPLAFNVDDSLVYFKCSAPGGFGICTWDPSIRKMSTLWSNPTVEPYLINGPAKGTFMGVGFDDGRPGVALFDSKSPAAQVLISLMQQFPGEDVRFVSATRDGSKAIVRVLADVDPGTYYLFDRDARKLTPLLKNAAWINPERMASKQPIEVTARDGLKLYGYISYPPGQEKAKNLPMVVYVHGGPFGERDYWYFDRDVQALATHGYAVLQVNYRGSGGYGYDFERAGWKEWGGKMQDDVTDATRWAIAQGIADPNRICIYGASYGGYAALEGAVKEPNLYKCAIGYVGVYDLPMLYTHGDTRLSTHGENFLKREVGTDMTSLAQHSPVHQLNNLKAKVMLIVGGRDETVPEAQGKELHMALLERGIQHEWLYEPDEMHGFYKEDHIAEVYTKVNAFLQANIGPGASGSGTVAAGGNSASPSVH